MTGVYGHQTRPHILGHMSIAYWKFIKIILPEFGGKDKRKKQKKSGNMGFKEFPRPLNQSNGGQSDVKQTNTNQLSPKTGDSTNPAFWLLVAMAASITGILNRKRFYKH